ncbi:hypothetical protein OF83DRAFT_1175970 [Amylostereum chailletii]|nr:hypothetical protein OF83DRAFT_1175970 [Amylostereum chailletii]
MAPLVHRVYEEVRVRAAKETGHGSGGLSTLAKSLIAAFTVLGALALGVLIWRTWITYKRRQKIPPSHLYGMTKDEHRLTLTNLNDPFVTHKPIVLPAVPRTPHAGWSPQIQNIVLPAGLAVPPPAQESRSSHSKSRSSFGSFRWLGGSLAPGTPLPSGLGTPPPTTPPPAYQQGFVLPTPLPTISVPLAPLISPPAIRTDFDSGAVSSPLSPFELPSPSLNPRTHSFNSKVSATMPSMRDCVSAHLSGSALPRLMVVCTSFPAMRADELPITVGESLRLLEEFEDQWCLVQRVGRVDAELGVIPRFCLAERPKDGEQRTWVYLPKFPFLGVKP